MNGRITIDPKQMSGEPCVRSLRIPVATVVQMVAEGMTNEAILKAFPDLELADISASLSFAARALREHQVPLIGAS